jgi:hypothetical protein
MTPSVVLSRSSPCNVPQGYASVAELPATLLGCHFEHPGGATVSIRCRLAQKYIEYVRYYAQGSLEFTDGRECDDHHHGLSGFRTS